MKTIIHLLLLAIPLHLFMGCLSDDDSISTDPSPRPPSTPATTYTEWLIPKDEVFDGGPGKDGIPSINEPNFSSVSDIDFIEPDELIIGVKVGNEIRGYPHVILDWHEIVNDKIDDLHLSISYCPLTGTNIGWKRKINGKETSFGVSGLVYNSNLIPYDRETDSYWSQIYTKSVNGAEAGQELELYPLIETSWEFWQQLFPSSTVLNTNTGFDRDYSRYPYYDYKSNDDLVMFPVNPEDNRLPKKQRGLGVIIEDSAKFYSLDKFTEQVTIIEDQLNNSKLLIIGSQDRQFVIAYYRPTGNGTPLSFQPIEVNPSPSIFVDNLGNEYNLFGEVIAGPNTGTRLSSPKSFMGFWFAWSSFYPEIDIY